jgi:hypothetical protein
MGWWKVHGTEDLVGDEVFQMLRDATMEVAAEYTKEFGRLPTRSEWQRLIQDALQPIGDLRSSEKESLFAENSRPREVQILLEPLPAKR